VPLTSSESHTDLLKIIVVAASIMLIMYIGMVAFNTVTDRTGSV
jgi:hypothetical protein